MPVGAFLTKDGAYVQVQNVTQPLFKAMVALIAKIEPKYKSLITDERFATPADRLKNQEALNNILKEVFIGRKR